MKKTQSYITNKNIKQIQIYGFVVGLLQYMTEGLEEKLKTHSDQIGS